MGYSSIISIKYPVKQPLTFAGVPRSRSGTVTGTPGTALYSDAIYVGDAEIISVILRVTNHSGTTHALIKYQTSQDFDSMIETGSEASPVASWIDENTIVADLSTDDTDMPYPLSPILTQWIRFEFSGAASNGAFKQARGVLIKQ